jgi:hypothetical protein
MVRAWWRCLAAACHEQRGLLAQTSWEHMALQTTVMTDSSHKPCWSLCDTHIMHSEGGATRKACKTSATQPPPFCGCLGSSSVCSQGLLPWQLKGLPYVAALAAQVFVLCCCLSSPRDCLVLLPQQPEDCLVLLPQQPKRLSCVAALAPQVFALCCRHMPMLSPSVCRACTVRVSTGRCSVEWSE